LLVPDRECECRTEISHQPSPGSLKAGGTLISVTPGVSVMLHEAAEPTATGGRLALACGKANWDQ